MCDYEEDYYDYFDYDDTYFMITNKCEPTLITCVSEFRHFVNVWGCCESLLNVFNLDANQARYIYDNFPGYFKMKEIVKDYNGAKARAKGVMRSKEKTRQRYETLATTLSNARTDFCTVGTRKTKLLLNKLAKTDVLAKAYRIALEAEDKNISAKGSYGEYVDKIYREKEANIAKLAELCKQNDWIYGRQNSDVKCVSAIVYFELPGCEQISFHTNLDTKDFPEYRGEWDKKECSTISKLENAITAILKNNGLL